MRIDDPQKQSLWEPLLSYCSQATANGNEGTRKAFRSEWVTEIILQAEDLRPAYLINVEEMDTAQWL